MSEFGKGLCYCLGLFLAHTESLESYLKMYREMREQKPDLFSDDRAATLWFYGSSDHLYEIQAQSAPTEELKKRTEIFQDKVLTWRGGFKQPSPTLENAYWAIQEAKDLLRLIDGAHGIPTEKGEWE